MYIELTSSGLFMTAHQILEGTMQFNPENPYRCNSPTRIGEVRDALMGKTEWKDTVFPMTMASLGAIPTEVADLLMQINKCDDRAYAAKLVREFARQQPQNPVCQYLGDKVWELICLIVGTSRRAFDMERISRKMFALAYLNSWRQEQDTAEMHKLLSAGSAHLNFNGTPGAIEQDWRRRLPQFLEYIQRTVGVDAVAEVRPRMDQTELMDWFRSYVEQSQTLVSRGIMTFTDGAKPEVEISLGNGHAKLHLRFDWNSHGTWVYVSWQQMVPESWSMLKVEELLFSDPCYKAEVLEAVA